MSARSSKPISAGPRPGSAGGSARCSPRSGARGDGDGELRRVLGEIYQGPEGAEIAGLAPDELIELAGNLEHGVPMASPVFDGASEDDIVGDARTGGALVLGPGDAGRRPHRRAVRPQGDGRLHLHDEAAPSGRRQDPRPLDRAVQPRHPAAVGRQGAVRRPALRRDGGVGARRPTARPTPCRRC